MGMYGDPASIATMATALQTAANTVSTSASDAGWQVALMVPSGWSGPAANAFVAHWNGEQTQMTDLSMAAATMAGTLNRLATSLQQANQLGAAGQYAAALSTAPNAAAQQGYALARAAWAQAMTELSAVSVPVIGPTTSPQQAQQWASSVVSSPIPVTSLQFTDTSGTTNPWQNRRPPFPPLFPGMNPGGPFVDSTQQPQPAVTPFPGGGVVTLQSNLLMNGGVAPQSSGGSVGGSSGVDWKAILGLVAAGMLASGAAAAASTPTGRKTLQDLLNSLNPFPSQSSSPLNSTTALSTSRGDPVPALDATGKVHGILPSHVPDSWTRQDLEQARHDLEVSIANRKAEQARLGEDGPHRARITEEEQLLRQIIKKLSGS
jgi:uncharacterized protein YukE